MIDDAAKRSRAY